MSDQFPKELRTPKKVVHRLPLNIVKEEEEDFIGYTSYTTQPVVLKEYKNVRLSPESVIYKNGLLVQETVALDSNIPYYKFRHLVKKYMEGKTIRLDPAKKYLLITDQGSSGYFHWLCEVLPKLVDLKESSHEFVLLLPDNDFVRKTGKETIDLLKLSFADIIFMNINAFYSVPKMYFIPSVSEGGLNDDLLKEINKIYSGKTTPASNRLYISRRKAAFRKILNEDDLTTLMTTYGFEVISAEDFSFAEQINLFSKANMLVGIHGAGLSNALLMPQNSTIVELRKHEGKTSNVAYWHLATALNHSYYYFNGTPDSSLPLVGRGCNLTIDIKTFEHKLLSKICG